MVFRNNRLVIYIAVFVLIWSIQHKGLVQRFFFFFCIIIIVISMGCGASIQGKPFVFSHSLSSNIADPTANAYTAIYPINCFKFLIIVFNLFDVFQLIRKIKCCFENVFWFNFCYFKFVGFCGRCCGDHKWKAIGRGCFRPPSPSVHHLSIFLNLWKSFSVSKLCVN